MRSMMAVCAFAALCAGAVGAQVPDTAGTPVVDHLLAENLKGHLLLAHGLVDDNVAPSNTLLAEHALMRASKDFDLVIFTDRAHGFGDDPYVIRRR